jgi:tmRNA-binding protein
LFHDLPLSKYLQKRLGYVKGKDMLKKHDKRERERERERESPCLRYFKKESGENHAKGSFII